MALELFAALREKYISPRRHQERKGKIKTLAKGF